LRQPPDENRSRNRAATLSVMWGWFMVIRSRR
jgi:hypothetical protein